jgi:hypothetical protein
MKLATACLAAFAGFAELASAGPARADLYGLVVGIDSYTGTSPLKGAVNDASDIADVLRAIGARRVELLTDEAARRQPLLDAWAAMLAEAKEGDTIIFSFAGHGAQEPDDHLPKDEADGYDEVFLLQGFSEADDAAFADKIYDDELYDWAKEAEAHGVSLILVFDACHAGIPVRSLDPRASDANEAYSGFRFTRYSTRPTEPSTVDDTSQLAALDFGENVIALGATDESLRVREQRVEGKPRGVLSWAFARALEGAADKDNDQAIASDELVNYVKHTVFDQARHRQIPQFFAPTRAVRLLTIAADPSTASGSGKPSIAGDAGAATPPTVSLFAPEDALSGLTIEGVDKVSAKSDADFVWDAATGDLIDTAGDVAAFALSAEALPAALAAQRLRRAIGGLVAGGNALDVSLEPDNKLHCAGQSLLVRGASAALTHYTAFNLPGSGEIQFLWPLSRYNDPLENPPGQKWKFETKVGEPFGSDMVVLIATDRPLEKLHAVLEYSAEVLDPLDLWKLLEASLKDVSFEIAVQDIFTRDGASGSEQCG